MSEFITPEVGKRYTFGGEDGDTVEVVEAVKKRYWRIVVEFLSDPPDNFRRTIPQAEWAAKARAL